MCLIIVGPMADEETLRNADIGNPHGAGVAWQTTRGVEFRKNMLVRELLELPQSVKDYCIVHFRLATAGGRTNDLIHPFVVSQESELKKEGVAERVLFHNGHISNWDSVSKAIKGVPDGEMSDSRLAAWLTWKYGSDILYLFANQRFATMTRKKVMLYGDWVEEGGRHYSNSTFRQKRWNGQYSQYRGSTPQKAIMDMDDEEWRKYYKEGWGDDNTYQSEFDGCGGAYIGLNGGEDRDTRGRFRVNGKEWQKKPDGTYGPVKVSEVTQETLAKIDKIADELVAESYKDKTSLLKGKEDDKAVTVPITTVSDDVDEFQIGGQI